MHCMRQCKFIALLGGTAALWRLAARAAPGGVLVDLVAAKRLLIGAALALIAAGALLVALWPSFAGDAARPDFHNAGINGQDALRHALTSASTRTGLPEPRSIFSGGVMSSAPVGGS